MADASNHFYYYIYNVQGDVIALADADTGKIAATYTYDAWGKCVSIENAAGFTVGNENPFRYKGYYFDQETGLYYLNSRYYDPEVGRFVNADSLLTATPTGTNLFAYCNDNPVMGYDPDGQFALSFSLLALIGLAAIVCAMPATQQAFADAGSAIADAYSEFCYKVRQKAKEINDKYPKSYTVYFLQDGYGTVQYVGRVKTENYASRMQYHYKTKKLQPKYIVSGLNYMQARGIEEVGMISCHTLNRDIPYNNKIHGISIFNPKRSSYLAAGEKYLANKAEDELLNLLQR